MGYCQLIILNHFHLHIKPELAKIQIKGQELHQKLEDKDKLIPRTEATKEELKNPRIDLDILRETIKVLIQRKNKNVFLYMGRIDKVIRTNGNVYIIDDKITKSKIIYSEPFLDRTLQLCSYCEGFKQNYSKSIGFKNIIFKIVQRDIKNNILSEYEKKYDDTLKKNLFQKFELFEKIYNQDILPTHHNNVNKCNACRYIDCAYKLKS